MTTLKADLGDLAGAVDTSYRRFEHDQIMARITRGDYTVWKPQPTEISNRLGWMTIADRMVAQLPEIQRVVSSVQQDGYTQGLVLGMGGSSLAPEVFRRTFGVAPGCVDLAILDSTDPAAVLAHSNRLDPARSLFVVSTKSGGTVETFSFFRYFYRWTVRALGADKAGAHFIAITDPGSALVDVATKYHFRATFLNDPDIGGRYSALSHFGLVPAALVGVDLPRLLERATRAELHTDAATRLGVILGELATSGRDKVTFVLSPAIAAFASWVEQLIAESTGKEGKGIVPVADEPLGSPAVYGKDRLFVDLRLAGDHTGEPALQALRAAGHPVVRLDLADQYGLGEQFFIWELAVAIAGWRLEINPFDQPNVESAKVLARKMVAAYEATGSLPKLDATGRGHGLAVYTAAPATAGAGGGATGTATGGAGGVATGAASVGAAGGGTGARKGSDPVADQLRAFLGLVRPGDYIAIQAYVDPTPETTQALAELRLALRDRYRVATTVGYGPRFLHSTGQLHKGDGGHGVFLQLVTAPPTPDLPIPDSADADTSHITFGVIKVAAALGDRQALLDGGRRVIRLDPDRIPQDVRSITSLIPPP
jgi:glucose-6-phosphate isomerase